MKKQIKGAVAAGAAGVLLLGGAGSYALWSDEQTISGGTLASGDLYLTPTGTPQWDDISAPFNTNQTADFNIATFKIVPGDVVTYTAHYTVDATGDNLKATVAADTATITGDADLKSKVTTAVSLKIAGTDRTEITSLDDGSVVDVVVTFTFDSGTTLKFAQNQALNLANFKIKVQQVRT